VPAKDGNVFWSRIYRLLIRFSNRSLAIAIPSAKVNEMLSFAQPVPAYLFLLNSKRQVLIGAPSAVPPQIFVSEVLGNDMGLG